MKKQVIGCCLAILAAGCTAQKQMVNPTVSDLKANSPYFSSATVEIPMSYRYVSVMSGLQLCYPVHTTSFLSQGRLLFSGTYTEQHFDYATWGLGKHNYTDRISLYGDEERTETRIEVWSTDPARGEMLFQSTVKWVQNGYRGC